MRTTKLMALLLAALMVVAVFAGCASGVKQEAFDGLEGRVEALEGAINGVKDSIENIEIPAADNKEILDAIKDVQTNLENKIESVNGRVEELEKEPVVTPGTTTTTPDAAALAAAQAALAKVEVKRSEFAKNADEYTEEDYAKILEALGAATSAINNAKTVADVDAALKTLETTLAEYMTYAMKAYDYYEKLLGNINADAEDLVAEAEDFLKAVKKYYKASSVDFEGKLDNTTTTKTTEVQAELAYLVTEGTTAAKDVYLDVYTALERLVDRYNGTSTDINKTKDVAYVTEKGKIDTYKFATLAAYEKVAKELVKDIDKAIDEELVYSTEATSGFKTLSNLITRYENYIEDAEAFGGAALVDLITNADKIEAAEDEYKNLEEAVKAFREATKVDRLTNKDVFYYYDELVKAGNVALLEYYDSVEDEDVIVADIFAEVDEILNDWVEAYDLSEENMLAIIAAEKKGDTKYYTDETAKGITGSADTYVARKHYNALLTAASEEFADEIADLIADLNNTTTVSVQLVLDYNEIVELIEDLKETQEADKNATYPANIAMPDIIDTNMKAIYKAAGLFEDYAEERLAAVKGYIDLFTFAGDVDQLEDTKTIVLGKPDADVLPGETDTPDVKIDEVYFDDTTDNRKYGDIVVFLTETYEKEIKPAADKINEAIEDLVEKVEENAIADNEAFITLSGDYVLVKKGTAYNGDTFASDVYVLVEDFYADDDDYKAYMEDLKAEDSIAAFNYHYEDFADMLDVAEFEAAQKTITDRVDDLFAEIDEIVALIDAIDYVRTKNAKFYVDADKDGEFDAAEEVAHTVKNIVSLNDAAAVKAAVKAYNDWVYAGGSTNIAYFAAYVDANDYEYDDVFKMVGLSNVDEINEALALLKTLDTAILKLEEQSAHFVSAVNNALAVHKANAMRADLDENHFNVPSDITDGGGSVKYWSWTKRTLSTESDAKDNEGSYTYIYKDKVWATTSGNSYTAMKEKPYAWLASKTLTKKDLLKDIAKMYDDFKLANVEYKADADNDYEAAEYYYQLSENKLPEYVAYKAFDDAVKSYEALDLLSVKGYVLATVADTNDATHSFRAQVNGATTLAALQNAIYQYNVTAGANVITAADLAPYAIYDFTRLS